MNLTREWLLKNGISAETLDRAIGEGGVREPSPEIAFELEFPGITFEPLVWTGTMTYLGIGGWLPASLNELARSVRGKIRLKKRDRAVVCEAARRAHLPRATGRRRMSLRIRVPKGQRRWDKDAFWKSAQDAAVHAGLLVDDGPVWYDIGTIVYDPDRGPLRTTIILEDLPGERCPEKPHAMAVRPDPHAG